MKHIHILIFICFIGCTTNTSNKNILEDINANYVEHTKLELDYDLWTPRSIYCIKNHIAVFDPKSPDGFIVFFDIEGNYRQSFGKIGEGPEEFISPRISINNDTLFVFDINQTKKITLNDFGEIKTETWMNEKKETERGINYAFSTNKSNSYIISKTSEEQIEYISNGHSTKYSYYPKIKRANEVDAFSINNIIFDANYVLSNDRNSLFIIYKYYPIVSKINTISMKKEKEYILDGKNSFSINKTNKPVFRDPLLYYTFGYSYGNNLYSLYQNSDRDSMKSNIYKSEIHIFDSELNELKRYKLMFPIYNFAVSNKNTLFVLCLNNELDPEIHKVLL